MFNIEINKKVITFQKDTSIDDEQDHQGLLP